MLAQWSLLLTVACAGVVRGGAVAASPLVAVSPLAAAVPVLAAPTAVSYQYSHRVHHPVVAAPLALPFPYVAG
ncbi:uncharacterized protein LOC144152587 [Haemaphysalis longicornis]